MQLSQSFATYFLMILQVASIIVIIERSIALFFKRKVEQKEISKEIGAKIRAGEILDALNFSTQIGKEQPIGKISEAAICAAIDFGTKDKVQEKMDQVLLQYSKEVEKRINYLPLLANTATVTGLAATIYGLAQCLGGFSVVDEAQKKLVMSQGISMAMDMTMYGLVVAIPALIMYAILQSRQTRLVDDLNKANLNIYIQVGSEIESIKNDQFKSVRKKMNLINKIDNI